jgi:hypothetical protein
LECGREAAAFQVAFSLSPKLKSAARREKSIFSHDRKARPNKIAGLTLLFFSHRRYMASLRTPSYMVISPENESASVAQLVEQLIRNQ